MAKHRLVFLKNAAYVTIDKVNIDQGDVIIAIRVVYVFIPL